MTDTNPCKIKLPLDCASFSPSRTACTISPLILIKTSQGYIIYTLKINFVLNSWIFNHHA